jgi:hypothetical protein
VSLISENARLHFEAKKGSMRILTILVSLQEMPKCPGQPNVLAPFVDSRTRPPYLKQKKIIG